MISTIVPDGSLDGGPAVGSSTDGQCSSQMHPPRNSTSSIGQKHPASNEKLCIIQNELISSAMEKRIRFEMNLDCIARCRMTRLG